MVQFKSSTNGATIKFEILHRYKDGIDFSVDVNTPFGAAKSEASTYFSGSPALLFQSMASEWRGWKDEKTWNDLEDRVAFSARSDLTGHTAMTVKLTNDDSSFKTVLYFDAGQLEVMANEISALLP
jgi:uncharacterized protein DUF6228